MITIIRGDGDNKIISDPHYLLRYNYMIGNKHGNMHEDVKISLDNPFVERYVKTLGILKPTSGTWGILLDENTIENAFDENQITKDDYNFLIRLMFNSPDSEYNICTTETLEFLEGVKSDNGQCSLIFEGVQLFYVDEFGKEYKTKFE